MVRAAGIYLRVMGIQMAFRAMWLTKIIQGETSWRRGLRMEPWTSLGFFKVIFIRAKLLYNTVLLSAVQESDQLYRYSYPLVFRFPSHLDHLGALSNIPCAIWQVLISYLFTIFRSVGGASSQG